MKKLLLLLSLLLAPALHAQYLPYSDVVLVNSQGAKVGSFATVTICTSSATGTPCSPKATIYSNAAGTGGAAPNPLTADQNGRFTFWSLAGTYLVSTSFGSANSAYYVAVGGAGGGGGGVTNVACGAGIQCLPSPIVATGTVSVPSGGITNTMLSNSSVTINAASPLGGGGLVSLGGVLNLTCPGCATGTVTGVTGVAPVASTGGAAPAISLQNSAAANVTAALGTDTKYPTASGSPFTSGNVVVGDAQGGITDSGSLLSSLAPKASPTFTGTVTAAGIVATNLTDSALTTGNCVQATTGGLLTTTSGACGTSSGTLTATGSPASGNLAAWSGGTSLTNGNLSGDATTSGTLAVTVVKINGTSLAGLATGILKNTTGTGVPSIAVAGDFPTLNQSTTGNAATATALATTPTQCTGAQFAQGIAVSGNANCATPSNVTGSAATITGSLVIGNTPLTINQDILYNNGGALARLPIATVPSGACLGNNSGAWGPFPCAGLSGSGTTNAIPKYTAANTVAPSLASDNGTTLSYSGTGGISVVSGPSLVPGTVASIQIPATHFASLPTAANGTIYYCDDCDPPASPPVACTSAGAKTGAMVSDINGAHICRY